MTIVKVWVTIGLHW